MLDKSINLARHLSARNEPDLLPFDFNNLFIMSEERFADPVDNENKFTKSYCETLVAKISSVDEHIPKECTVYEDVRAALVRVRRRDSDRHDHAVAFQGMNSGQALSAMVARERGHLNPSQIQRRYTNRRNSDRRVW